MKVLLLSSLEDNGGQGAALKQALERHTDWDVRHVMRRGNFLDYAVDVQWTKYNTPAILDLWRKADVVHMFESFEPWSGFEGYERKPRVLHHLGYEFRMHHETLSARGRAEGIPQLVASLDMLAYGPDLIWLPLVCDIERMRAAREAYRPGQRVRVMQTPASRDGNDVDEFLAAMADVTGVEVSLIEGLPWVEAIARKAQADILFDSFATGYGLSVIEAWGMGIPTVCGSGDTETEFRILDTFGFLPYLPTNPAYVARHIDRLARDPSEQRRYATLGREAVERFHAEAEVVKRLVPVYEAARDLAVAA